MNEAACADSRRAFLKNGLVLGGVALLPAPVRGQPIAAPTARTAAATVTSPRIIRPELLRRALGALEKHGSRIAHRDRIAIADFAAASSQPRFHFLDVASGRTTSLLVSHGSGSDPRHTGFLSRFSNEFNSNASSQGAFATSDYYVGKHGRSQRLIGLDETNCNALDRAIVVHAAWYANRDMLRTRGVLGRSQGCFAVGEGELDEVFARLGAGRMIYSAKV